MSTTYVESELSHGGTQSQRSSTTVTTKRRYRDSTHLIPTPGAFKIATRFRPLILSLPVVVLTPLIMFASGVALEVALAISERNNGYPLPARNVFQIASTQFLLSFVPTIFTYPLGMVWRELAWFIRLYQPYIVLSNGNAKAEESLLLDYIALGPGLAAFYGIRFKHRLVVWSSITAILTYLLSPLAGTVLQVQDRPQYESATVTSTKTLGLDPDFTSLAAFAAAAGFVEAAVFNNLTDPPFVDGKWAIAEFVFPIYAGFNGSMTINTTSIKTEVNCENPASFTSTTNTDGTFLVSATSQEGCKFDLTIDTKVSNQQYGVNSNSSCSSTDGLAFGTSQQGVVFWFFHTKFDNTPEAKVIFCNPSIEVFDVTASANLASGQLTKVDPINSYPNENNVTGRPLNSHPFNGVVFDGSSFTTSNPFIQARQTATNIGVPGAIFRSAGLQDGGLQKTFDLPNGFLDLTSTVYTQHLSLVAKSVYFVTDPNAGSDGGLNAVKLSFLPRLWINAIPAHLIALILALTGVSGIIMTIINHRRLKRLSHLATHPGSLGSAIALTSHSGFGEMLMPFDNEETIERKLRNLRFRLDRRTGAVVAEEWFDNDDGGGDGKYKGDRDETMMSLLGTRTNARGGGGESFGGQWAYATSPEEAVDGLGLSLAPPPASRNNTAPPSRSSTLVASHSSVSASPPKKISPSTSYTSSSTLSPTTALMPVPGPPKSPRSPGPHITFSDAA